MLFSVFEAKRRKTRPSLVYCGDNVKAKRTAASLISEVGFDPLDTGPLQTARYIEPFSLLVARIAYEGKGGPEVAYVVRRL